MPEKREYRLHYQSTGPSPAQIQSGSYGWFSAFPWPEGHRQSCEVIYLLPRIDGETWLPKASGMFWFGVRVDESGSRSDSKSGTRDDVVAWARGTGVDRILIDRAGTREFTPLDD